MSFDRIEKLLAASAAQPLPPSAEPATAEIWREIDQRRQQSVWTRMFAIFEVRELFSEPRMALAAVAFALMVGAVPAALVSRSQNERRLARQSIHFEVFAADSASLGSVFANPVGITPSPKR